MNTTKVRTLATAVTLAFVLGIAQYLSKTSAQQYPGGQGPYPKPPGGVVTNITILTNVNIFAATNVTIYDSLTVNTNVTVNQNFSVKGNATFNNITVTNQLQFLTNAFPLAAGTVWNFTKPYQLIITNNDFTVTGPTGFTNYAMNFGVLVFSNSDSATHFMDLSSGKYHVIGPNSTNKLYVGAGKVGIASGMAWGSNGMTNLVTAVEQ
jgi:hypothetical protein